MCLYAHIADNTNSTSFKKKKLCHKWCSSSDYIVLIKLVRICPFTIAQRRLLTHNWTFRQECVYSITHAYWLGWLIAWCCYKFQKCCISCNTGHLGFYLMCTVCTCWGLWPSGHAWVSGKVHTTIIQSTVSILILLCVFRPTDIIENTITSFEKATELVCYSVSVQLMKCIL